MSFLVYLFLFLFYIWKVEKSSYNNPIIAIEKKKGRFVMIFQSFLLGNLVSLCMKIINSVVVVGLYYGFLTTFSIGPSYLFLLQAQVMEEGTEKKVSATTGFITGQLMMFISIYYAPLHLALGRPHTITVLALPYLLFHFFWHNHKDFAYYFDYGSTTRNSMRNFSIQCLFLNNLIFQLFNHFILPSSMLARLVNIYMFRCNNKMLFVTSSFVGWLIGHILFMKWLGLVLVWIRQNYSIRSNKYIRSKKSIRPNKYLVAKLRYFMARIFSILFFITCVYYLGRTPSPLFTKKLKETSKMEEEVESEEERDVEIETASEMKGTKQEQEGSTEEDPSPSFFSEERADPNKIDETEEIRVNGKENEFHFRFTETGYKNRPVSEESYLMNINENQDNSRFQIFHKKTEKKKPFFFDNPLLTLLFDWKRWNRPFRYIKNNQFERAVRNEMSQYFFDICQSDGKERICFTYPPSLSIFLEMIKRRISWSPLEKFSYSYNELYNPWVYTNKEKGKSFNNEFLNRIKALDKEDISWNRLETRTQLCNDDSKKEYLSKRYDPFLNGSYRKTIYKNPAPSTLKKTLIKNFIDKFRINRIHGILLSDTDYQEFEQQINRFDKKPLSTKKKSLSTKIVDFLTFKSQFVRESESTNLNPRGPSLYLKYLLTKIVTDANGQKINRKSIKLKEISKKIPRWSYKLITEIEQYSEEYQEEIPVDHEIRSRQSRPVVVLAAKKGSKDTDEIEELTLTEFSVLESDFRRDLIKGSMRAQRRKVVILRVYQPYAQSPLFLERLPLFPFFSFDISGLIKRIFRNGLEAFKILEYTKEQTKREEQTEKEEEEEGQIGTAEIWEPVEEEQIQTEAEREEEARLRAADFWDYIDFGQEIRTLLLLTHSIFRKYILLPSLIIAKNIGRILLLQIPEWSEDFEEWKREVHFLCNYNGVPVPENEFPKDWALEGIQIKIVFPFYLKPWRKSKLQALNLLENQTNFCFLTAGGLETDIPFGFPRRPPSFFKPILKELKKKLGKSKRKYFRKVSKETKEWVIKSVLFIKKIIKKLSKVNPILSFILREVEVYESSEIKEEKDSIISNRTIHESFSQIASPSWTNSLLTEKKMKDLTDRTSIIRNQIEKITKEKTKVTPRINNLSPNKRSYNAKRFEKWQILKRRNARLTCKLPFFFKFFIEKIYTDIFIYIINILRKNTEFFLELTKKIIDKSIYNNERKQERINKKKKTPIPVISTIKKPHDNISNIKANSHIFYDLSYVSQAYVFYKLSQIQVSTSLRSVVQYQGIPFFLKPKIKDSFERQGMVHSKLADKKLPSYEMNQWKNWLRGHYQYHLSRIRWSRLIPEKWRTTVHQCHIAKKENLSKWHSYEKDQLIDSKKQFEVDSLSNQNGNFLKYLKYSRYDLLSYKFINYENKTEFFYGSPFQGNKNQAISYNMPKESLFDMWKNIPIKNFLGKVNILYMKNPTDRKYFDWKIFNFYLRQKGNIEARILIDINRNQNTQIRTNNSQKISKKDLFYLMIPEINPPNSHKGFLDWVGMNKKRPKLPMELWFFSEFVSPYKVYKMKPWFIPSKLLLLNLNRSGNKKINEKEKGSLLIASNLSQQKDIKENYAYNSNTEEEELEFFLERYLLFQLKLDKTLDEENFINNFKIYNLLIRLIDPRRLTASSVRNKEMALDIMLIQRDVTLSELTTQGVLTLETIRPSGQKDGQFIMYQTIGISLVHKSKHQTNQRYQEQRYVSKKNFDETISPHHRITGNRNENDFDLLVPENILSFRRRKKLTILFCFNSKNRNSIDRNSVFWNGKSVKDSSLISNDNNHLDREKNQLMKLKLFLWPNYRLEDLACMNRYWFDTNNGSRLSMLRIHMYPRLKICG
uniref:YCF1 protein n=1 Tax=Dicrastylis parvifolia TaxID=664368 RepID=UPI001D028EAF|nr:YCF1 protein [Dicrastylis parvifolia]QVL24695.1 YCF1 protein [Dicrastylis parvifolia]